MATTGTDGNYSFPSLPVGAYEFTAEDWDSRQKCCVALIWRVAQPAVVNLTLQVGNVEQRVTITGEAPLMNTTLSSTSGLIHEQQPD